MPVPLRDVISFLDRTLEIDKFRDYGPNGLQVEGRSEVSRVITGVSACIKLFEQAIEREADLVVVHHGLIWGGGLRSISGPVARRLGLLLSNGISLAAYHLPLDDHARLGNNVGLCDAIGLTVEREKFGDVRGCALGMAGRFARPLGRGEALDRIAAGVLDGQAPHFVFPHGSEVVQKVGLCSGAASDLIEDAAQIGCDLYLTGELAERAGELARELAINLVAAGHYATEVHGPTRVADELARCFSDLEVQFVGVPSPL